MQRDRGLERLDLRHLFRLRREEHGGDENGRQHDEFRQARQPLVALRQANLAQAQQARDLAGEFLQGAEGAEPAAKRSAPPDEQATRPKTATIRVGGSHRKNTKLPSPLIALIRPNSQTMENLRLRDPADEHQREGEIGQPEILKRARRAHQRLLAGQRHGENQQAGAEDGNVARSGSPRSSPDPVPSSLGRQVEQVLRQAVAQLEIARYFFGEDLALFADHPHGKFRRRGRIESGLRRDAHDRDIACAEIEVFGNRQVQPVAPDEIAPGHRRVGLVERDQIGRGAGHEIFRHEGPAAAGHHHHRRGAVELVHQLAPMRLARADCARRWGRRPGRYRHRRRRRRDRRGPPRRRLRPPCR